jgi:hypothetical protein
MLGAKEPVATTLLPSADSASVYGSLQGFVNAGGVAPFAFESALIRIAATRPLPLSQGSYDI